MQTVLRQLSIWRRRERFYRAGGGVMRWSAVVLLALAAACAIDWWIDRTRDTPFALRLLLTASQVALGLLTGWAFVGRLRIPTLDALAAHAEGVIPAFGHRLVTAVQLNRDAGKVAGVSAPMLDEVTREAAKLAKRERLQRLADPATLLRAMAMLAPVLLVWAGFAAYRPGLAETLVARQALLGVEIDRAVKLTNLTPELWPAGDAVTVRVRVTGPVPDDAVGTLRLEPDGQPAETLPLLFESRDADGVAVFKSEVPPTGSAFAFRAWVGGGRLKQPGRVGFEARPAVASIEAFAVLPAYVDPTGTREFRRYQPQGEVFTIPDASIDVAAEFSKPVANGVLVLVRRDAAGTEAELGRVGMTLNEARTGGQARAALPKGVTGYRIAATDDHGFTNPFPPFRGVTIAPDRPPTVSLLAEALKDPKEDGPLDDYLVDGMPLRLGGQVQVGYTARSPIGIKRAYLVYRVNDGPWTPLPLTSVTADTAKVGAFVPSLGVFTESGPYGQVELFPVPAADPTVEPDGLQAGGRVNFKTSALKKRPPGATRDVELEVGDTVEIRVAVYDRHPAPARPPTSPPPLSGGDAPASTDNRRPAGWSAESRIKQVVTDAKFEAWRQEHYRTRVKLADLEQKQRDVFRPKAE